MTAPLPGAPPPRRPSGAGAVPSLSIVLIACNQAWNVPRLIRSALEASRFVPARQVVLVDSASTDATAALAARHPIGVIRIHGDGAPLTPAAGRYVGTTHTSGELILFLDGDMELVPGWLEAAFAALREDPSAAAVTGELIDRTPEEDGPPPAATEGRRATATPVAHAGGAALYRRAVLEEVGTFDPWLHAEEEPELCLRIRRRGHRVIRLDLPIAVHRTLPEHTLVSLLARRRRRLHLGSGQIARRLAGTSALGRYLYERSFIAVSLAAILPGALALAHAAATGRRGALRAWGAVLALLAARDLARSRRPEEVIFSLARRVVIVEGFVRGAVARSGPPDAFPMRVEVVADVPPPAEPPAAEPPSARRP
jgi:glycosyltransferase involved in cell wall biosynthesis